MLDVLVILQHSFTDKVVELLKRELMTPILAGMMVPAGSSSQSRSAKIIDRLAESGFVGPLNVSQES